METKDPTTLAAWKDLNAMAAGFHLDLRKAFAADPARAENLSFSAADLHVDLSKNLITGAVFEKLLELSAQAGVRDLSEAMFNGERINNTENRAVLHTALRAPAGTQLVVDGKDVIAQVHEVLGRIYDFADSVRDGSWVGVSSKRIQTVVNIGIGGSDLGPYMAYEALRPFVKPGLECRFVSNIDPTDIAEKTRDLDPETTLFIIASKTFTTLETITNAKAARTWLLRSLQERGVIDKTEEAAKDAISKHFVAVSTALDKVADFGIDPRNAFGFWNWVGGRYSVDSAVGTSLAVAIGREGFEEFLAGFRAIDEHFRSTPPASNVPLLMGLLNVWYSNFLHAQTHAVLPYSQYLHRFPAYLQQLTMESNGKRVRRDGTLVSYDTGEVFWGEPGTNGQHAFYQLIHQGTRLIPVDFIAFARPTWDLTDSETGKRQHELFLGNFFAQSAALAFGKTPDEVRAEGTKEELVAHRTFPGDRPSTSIMAPALTPKVLGELIALYEMITLVEGTIWGIDSFDQWGVELGKAMAIDLGPAISGDAEALAQTDASTRGLLEYYFAHK
ncbi:glucose-6-phosphate isomerase [Mobiluncus sp.]|uniref:glucose-6-phosphate isomerase n=1 Tax=Mobiluncus sp. TaxID=47293 RepID=UPI002A90E3BB|nr:glucose-6-phosphate isomerase [Mobiluncus sp.]MDY6076866.1 glucose-6-phosphate isomerase [Mobiluncus sp.]